MTDQERKEWHQRLSKLEPAKAAQWTEEVYEKYLQMQKARGQWQRANGSPSDVLGSVKPEGQLTPLFIPNDPYLRYQDLQQEWVRGFEPAYIKDERARMSRGDFGEEDDWS